MLSREGRHGPSTAWCAQAYRKWVAEGGKNQQLPGLKMTYDQLFFINYAQVWCGSYRPEFAVQSIKTDVHSPLKFRQVASAPRVPALAGAFSGSSFRPQGAGLAAELGRLRKRVPLRSGHPHAPPGAMPRLVA